MEKKNHADLSGSQTVIGIGDYHDKDHKDNKEQGEYLCSFIKRFNCSDIKLIVEDLSSINNDGKGVCCNYVINPSGGVLGKLADKARDSCIEVDNVEYRFCRVAGIGPLLNNLFVSPKNFSSAMSLSIEVLCKEVLEQLACISSYNSGAFINSLYKRIICDVTKAFNKLKLRDSQHLSIADYCMRLSAKNYKKSLEKMCIFDSPLIDAKILHSITSSNKSIIVVTAGGSHIEKMNDHLGLIGYKKIYMTPMNSHKQQFVVESALNSEKNHHIARPQSVNIRLLEQFIH